METKEHEEKHSYPTGKGQNSKIREDGFLTFSQFTYTLYSNGYWENKTVNTDGTVYSQNHGNWVGHPIHGDIKHRESVWRNNAWVDTV